MLVLSQCVTIPCAALVALLPQSLHSQSQGGADVLFMQSPLLEVFPSISAAIRSAFASCEIASHSLLKQAV